MCYAIWKGDGEVEALLEAYNEAFEENNLAQEYKFVTRRSADNGEYEEQIELLDRDQNMWSLEGKEIHRGVDYDGLINWSVVAWSTQTGFSARRSRCSTEIALGATDLMLLD